MNDRLTWFQLLESIRSEIHNEHQLIAHRLNWYTTTQSFLLTAYAIALGNLHTWPSFFIYTLPILGFVLSLTALGGVAAALVVQADLINLQSRVINRTAPSSNNVEPGDIDLETHYQQLTCEKRKTRYWTHWVAMGGPLVIPVVFIITWIAAYVLGPSFLFLGQKPTVQ